MKQLIKQIRLGLLLGVLGSSLSLVPVLALGSQQNPQNGSLGLEATIPSSPPSTAATIAIPSNGQTFSSVPIAVSGLCPNNLLIKIMDNNVFVGSTVCSSGSYNLKIGLFNGTNDLYAQDSDALGQNGPNSNTVSVTFNSGQYSAPGSQVTITSPYAEQGANPTQQLEWPIVIGGGVAPYAISTSWGDGLPPSLQSSAVSGKIYLEHSYSVSGIYLVSVTVADNKGATGFIQFVAVANGQLSPTQKTNVKVTKSSVTSVPWWTFLFIAIALWPAFWLGSRHGRSMLARKFE